MTRHCCLGLPFPIPGRQLTLPLVSLCLSAIRLQGLTRLYGNSRYVRKVLTKKTLKCLWEWPLPETMDSDSLSRNFTLQLCLCVCGHSVLISLKPPCVFYIRLYQCLLPSRCFCSRTYDFHISRISYPPEAENLIRRSRSTIYMFWSISKKTEAHAKLNVIHLSVDKKRIHKVNLTSSEEACTVTLQTQEPKVTPEDGLKLRLCN